MLKINAKIQIKFGKKRGVTDPTSVTDAVGTAIAQGFTMKSIARNMMANTAPTVISTVLFTKRSF